MFRQISVTVIIFFLVITAGVGAQEGETPPPPSTPIFDVYHFPTGLFCSEIDISNNAGPTWGNIQIGISSVEELNNHILGLSDLYHTQGLQGDRISYYVDSSRLAETENIPLGLTACVIDSAIWLIQVTTLYQENTLFLREFVEDFGLPDAITWSEFPQTRIAFWFEQGIMAEINIDTSDENIEFGEVISIVYFPYQDNKGFEERWPYNRTRTSPPISNFIQTPPLPIDQNPFDFDTLLESTLSIESSDESDDPISVDTISITHACPTDPKPSLGPSWHEITIGVSNHSAIQELYGVEVAFHNLILAEEGFAYANGIFLTPSNAEKLGLPGRIEYCQVNNTLLAISMGLPTDGTYPVRSVGQIGDIIEWLLEYDQPEIVAWREGTSDWCSRILVWPEYGMAVNFDVSVVDSEPTLAWATEIALFPFATGDNYLNRWPYNDYVDNTAPTGNNLDGCPTDQNPFDFEDMLANQDTQSG